MASDAGLSQQPNTLQQHLTLNKKKGNFPWTTIFILLFAINIIYIFWAASLTSGCDGVGCMGILALFIYSLPLALMDVMTLLSYGFLCRPRGAVRVIWFISLILSSLPLIYAFILCAIVLLS